MLDNYFGLDYTDEQKKRLLAVQAALEIVVASVSASTGYDGKEKLERDLKHATENISSLADAIQTALKDE
jgi:hypothetical protein